MPRPVLIGRDADVHAIAALIAPSRTGGAVVVGAAGVGTTAIVEAVVERVDPARLRVRASGADAHLAEALAQRPHAVERDEPDLVVIDDLHLIEARAAEALARLLFSGRARLLGTMRAGEAWPAALAPGTAVASLLTLHHVGELDRAACDELAQRIAGTALDAATRLRLWRLTEGNPLHLVETIELARSTGAIVHRQGLSSIHLPDSAVGLLRSVRERIDHLEPALAELGALLAVAGPLPVQLIVALGDEPTLARAVVSRLVQVTPDGIVGLAHALHGEALRARLGPASRRAALARLLAVVDRAGVDGGGVDGAGIDPLDHARWLVEAGDPRPEHLDVLVAAIDRMGGGSSPAVRERIAGAAWRLGARGRVGGVYADALSALGRHDEVIALAPEIAAADPRHAGSTLGAAAVGFAFGFGHLDRARAMLDLGDPASPHIRLVRATMALFFEGPVALIAADTVSLDPRDVALGLPVVHLQALIAQGRAADAAALGARILASPASGATPESSPTYLLFSVWADITAGRLGAAPLLRAAWDSVVASDDGFQIGWVAHHLARLAEIEGNLLDAVAMHLESATSFERINRPGLAAIGRAGAAGCLAMLGRVADARLELATLPGLDAAGATPMVFLRAERAVREAAVHQAAAGRLDPAAVGLLRGAIAAAARSGEGLTELDAWWDLRHTSREPSHLRRLDALAEQLQGALAAHRLAHLHAVGRGDLTAMIDAADALWACGARLSAVTALADAGRFAREDARGRDAASIARLLAERLHELPHRPAPWVLGEVAGPAVLSRRELDVARLIADGLPRADVARRLFLSPRTVDSHLQRVYAKLGVSSRTELRSALGRLDVAPASPPTTDVARFSRKTPS